MFRHPEVAAQRPSKGDSPSASAASFEARLWRAPQDDGLPAVITSTRGPDGAKRNPGRRCNRTIAGLRFAHPGYDRHFSIDTGLYFSYTTILARVKDMARRHTVSWERGRCPRVGLQPAPGRLGHHVSRHYDRGGRCIPGLGQAKAGNARSDHVPGSLA
jgi:hypothetical protein